MRVHNGAAVQRTPHAAERSLFAEPDAPEAPGDDPAPTTTDDADHGHRRPLGPRHQPEHQPRRRQRSRLDPRTAPPRLRRSREAPYPCRTTAHPHPRRRLHRTHCRPHRATRRVRTRPRPQHRHGRRLPTGLRTNSSPGPTSSLADGPTGAASASDGSPTSASSTQTPQPGSHRRRSRSVPHRVTGQHEAPVPPNGGFRMPCGQTTESVTGDTRCPLSTITGDTRTSQVVTL